MNKLEITWELGRGWSLVLDGKTLLSRTSFDEIMEVADRLSHEVAQWLDENCSEYTEGSWWRWNALEAKILKEIKKKKNA